MTFSTKTVDIEQIIKEKNAFLYRFLPRFILRYLKRKLHEKEINECIDLNKNKVGLAFNEACLQYVQANISCQNIERLPVSGGVIVVANHPLGGIDGMALIQAVATVRKDVQATVNDILTYLKNFDSVFVGVNKVGHASIKSLKAIEDFYASNGVSIVFPAGLVSRKQNGEIKDLEWKKSCVSKSVLYNKPILPVFIEGKNSDFFYNFALWRKRLGIKANIEMFFLPEEMFSLRNKNITLKFGELIHPDTFDKSKTYTQWAHFLKEKVYALK
ncbi:MAG: glycerol acyltransferase [Bacteroidetes bacterium]|nr:glycerol acyltransferase [Bacteroidota bacterium]